MKKTLLVVCLAVFGQTGCIMSHRIVEVTGNPARYMGRNVRLEGVVTQAAGAVIAGTYVIDDGTGRMRVLTNMPPPPKGTPVQVTGRLGGGVMVLNKSFGTTLQERSRKVLRRAPTAAMVPRPKP